jgi:hypothetical protein
MGKFQGINTNERLIQAIEIIALTTCFSCWQKAAPALPQVNQLASKLAQ